MFSEFFFSLKCNTKKKKGYSDIKHPLFYSQTVSGKKKKMTKHDTLLIMVPIINQLHQNRETNYSVKKFNSFFFHKVSNISLRKYSHKKKSTRRRRQKTLLFISVTVVMISCMLPCPVFMLITLAFTSAICA